MQNCHSNDLGRQKNIPFSGRHAFISICVVLIAVFVIFCLNLSCINIYDVTPDISGTSGREAGTNAPDEHAATLYSTDRPAPDKTITIGTMTHKRWSPFAVGEKYGLAQSLYLQSEIMTAGEITKLSYHTDNAEAYIWDQDVWIWIDHTTATSLGGTYIPYSNLVFHRASGFTISTLTGGAWFDIVLDTHFIYDNTSNIVITVRTRQTTYDLNVIWFQWDTSTYTRTLQSFSGYEDPPSSAYPQDGFPIIRLEIVKSSTPVLTLVKPDKYSVWKGGTNQTVEWTVTSGTSPYRIWANFSTNGTSGHFMPIPTIQDLTQPSAGIHSAVWTIPECDSDNCRVMTEIIDVAGRKRTAVHPANFTIYTPPRVVSVKPLHNSTNIALNEKVTVVFSEPMNPTAAESSFFITPDIGNWSWSWNPAGNVMVGRHDPFNPNTTYHTVVNVFAEDLKGYALESDFYWNFTTGWADEPLLAIIKRPAGGENFTVGMSERIEWYVEGGIPPYIGWLNYSTDSGATWSIVPGAEGFNQSLPGGLSFNWTVPDTPSDNCTMSLTVSDAAHRRAIGFSNSTFSIKPGTTKSLEITVITPNGGENWTSGSVHDVRWSLISSGANITNITCFVSIEYSTDNGTNWIPIESDITGRNYTFWTVPDISKTSSACLVRATARTNESIPMFASDTSDSTFTIYASNGSGVPYIRLITPAGGENWTAGTVYDIRWSLSGKEPFSDVTLEYSINGTGGPYNEITKLGKMGRYSWTVPIPDNPSFECYIKATVTDGDKNILSDINKAPFTIWTEPSPHVSLLSPNGGETWTSGTIQKIKWTVSGGTFPLKVDLSVSITGKNGYFKLIGASINATAGEWQWVVENTVSSDCFVKIEVYDSHPKPRYSSDTSDSGFAIVKSEYMPIEVFVKSPVAGDILHTGNEAHITWSRQGGAPPFTTSIEISYDSAYSYSVMAENATDNGTSGLFIWHVPMTESTQCIIRVKVTDTTGKSNTSTSGIFEIRRNPSPMMGGIDGYVLYANGTPAQNVDLSLSGTGRKTLTDSNGYYIFQELLEGNYTVDVQKTGYIPVHIDNVSVVTGKITRVDMITLQPENAASGGDSISSWLFIAGIGATVAIVAVFVFILLFMLIAARRRKDAADKNAEHRHATAGTIMMPQAQPTPILPHTMRVQPKTAQEQQRAAVWRVANAERGASSFSSTSASQSSSTGAPLIRRTPPPPTIEQKRKQQELLAGPVAAAAPAIASAAIKNESGQSIKTADSEVYHPNVIIEDDATSDIATRKSIPSPVTDEKTSSFLKTLDEMRARGLISEESYRKKRENLILRSR